MLIINQYQILFKSFYFGLLNGGVDNAISASFFAETDKVLFGAYSVSAESAIDDNCQKSRNIKFHDEETTFQDYK